MKIMNFLLTSGFIAAAGFSAVPALAAVTIGSPAVPAAQTDGCAQCTFVLNEGFNRSGLSISDFTFYANAVGSITPLLLTRSDNGANATFTVEAVGLTRTAAPGVNQFSFDAIQGINKTNASSYFGFAYTNGGVVAFSYPGAAYSGTFVGPSGYTGAFGSSFTDNTVNKPDNSYDALNARQYSINVSAVPEPAIWSMMIAGFGIVGVGMRRRRQNVRLAYA